MVPPPATPARYATVAWIGLDPDPADPRLNESFVALEVRSREPGPARAHDSDIAAAFAALDVPVHLIAFAENGREGMSTQLTQRVQDALVSRADIIVIPADVLNRLKDRADLTALALTAWKGGALIFTTPLPGTQLAPPGAFNIAALHRPHGRCERTIPAAEDTLLLCVSDSQLRPSLSRLDLEDTALVIASTVVARCGQMRGAAPALDGAVAALALQSLYPKPLPLAPLRCEHPKKLMIAGVHLPWSRPVAELERPLDQKATLGASVDPALQLQVLLHPQVLMGDFVAALRVARLTPYYLDPGDPTIAILRFLPRSTPGARAAGTELLRTLRGTGANDLFSVVAADTFIDTK